MKLPSSPQFKSIQGVNLQRSKFNLSHTVKTTLDAGYLVPVARYNVYPGDVVTHEVSSFCRILTLLTPLMDNLVADFHFWYVPFRLVQTNFPKMMGVRENPDDDIDYLSPKVTTPVGGVLPGTLYDYLGVRKGIAGLVLNNWYARAYALIYNEHYRDTNLIDKVPFDVDDGADTYSDYSTVRRRGKRKDYFTSALPWGQRGDAVGISLAGDVPVLGIGKANQTYSNGAQTPYESDGTTSSYSSSSNIGTTANNEFYVQENPDDAGYPNLHVSLTNVSAITINALRQANAVQTLLERDARGGNRFNEQVLAHWGVQIPDFRIMRPEYLGGGTAPVNISPIAQTSESDAGTPQGNLAGIGTLSTRGIGYRHSFPEWGVVLCIVSFRADLTYQQGTHRDFFIDSRYDMYHPEFAHLGEQVVYNREIFTQGTSADTAAFGYQEYGAHLRYIPSMITGKLNSDVSGGLDIWHLAQDFDSLPGLDQDFIEENPPLDRVVAVTDEPHFKLDVFHSVAAIRQVPVFSTPSLMDRI